MSINKYQKAHHSLPVRKATLSFVCYFAQLEHSPEYVSYQRRVLEVLASVRQSIHHNMTKVTWKERQHLYWGTLLFWWALLWRLLLLHVLLLDSLSQKPSRDLLQVCWGVSSTSNTLKLGRTQLKNK